MARFLARLVLTLIGNAIGLIVAAWILDDMALSAGGFILAVVIFTLAFLILQPLIIKIAIKYADALSGGTALVSTLVALIITNLLTDSLSISGLTTWVLATLIIWLVSLIAGVILPLFLFKKALGRAGDQASARRA